MAASSTVVVINGLITVLALLDELAAHGKLSPEALEEKIAADRDLRKALVEEAKSVKNADLPESAAKRLDPLTAGANQPVVPGLGSSSSSEDESASASPASEEPEVK